jgi:hypothetical protein
MLVWLMLTGNLRIFGRHMPLADGFSPLHLTLFATLERLFGLTSLLPDLTRLDEAALRLVVPRWVPEICRKPRLRSRHGRDKPGNDEPGTLRVPPGYAASTGYRNGRRGVSGLKMLRSSKSRQLRVRATSETGSTRRSAARRPQRGTNARLIGEILQASAPHAMRAAEIGKALQDKGVAMAFASIGHALGQLQARNAAEQVGDSKTWRHRNGAS